MISAATPSFKFYRTPLHFVVSRTQLQHIAAGTKTQLVLDRSTGHAFDGEHFNPLTTGGFYHEDLVLLEIYAFLGVLRLKEGTVWVVVTEANTAANIGQNKILVVKTVELVPINPCWQPDAEDASTLAEMQKVRFTQFLAQGFYFSDSLNVTNTLQKIQGKKGWLHTSANPTFYWNREMYNDLAQSGVSEKWFIPLIQGFVTNANEFYSSANAQIVLISRRSCLRGGCSGAESGVDDEGNVANFVETEQIVHLNGTWYSFVQVRGTVPLFWHITGVSTSTRSLDSTSPAFLRHFGTLIRTYSHVMVINLLCPSKSEESAVNEQFNRLMEVHQQRMEKQVCYFTCDIKTQAKVGAKSQLAYLMDQIKEMLTYYAFFSMVGGQTQMIQKGVPRVNCLDCLDRTNLIMARIAWEVLTTQFEMSGVNIDLDYDNTQLTHPLLKSFRNMWADTGNGLSRLYVGVGSASASATRSGKSGFKAFLNSSLNAVERLISTGWEKRQELIDLMLGSHKAVRILPQAIAHREDEYVKKLPLKVHVCTWNMAGNRPPKTQDLSHWLIDPETPDPDLVVVGLQEMVPLNTKNVLSSGNQTLTDEWKELILATLNRSGRVTYSWIQSQDMVGCLVSMFAQSRMLDHIKGVARDVVKVGFGNMAGNKGGVLLRIQIKDTSICFWNCHLESGMEQTEARMSQLEDICTRAFASNRKVQSVEDHGVKVLMGDLNFRISLKNLEVRDLLEAGNIERLKQSDQLLVSKSQFAVLKNYIEGNINFLPTYKYDKNSNQYDTSKKMRVPAWCDRVLVCGKDVLLTSYRRSEYLYSDHRPVSATLVILVREILHDKLTEIEEQERVRSSLPASLPIATIRASPEFADRSTRAISEVNISAGIDLLSIDDEAPRVRGRTTVQFPVSIVSEARVRPPPNEIGFRVSPDPRSEERKQSELLLLGDEELLDFNVKSRPRPNEPQSFV